MRAFITQLTDFKMLWDSWDKNGGNLGCSLQMDQNNSSSSQPENGDLPESISYSKTPKDHQSTHWLYFKPFIIYKIIIWRYYKCYKNDTESRVRHRQNIILHLRCHIIWSSTKCVGCSIQINLKFTHTEVGYADVSVEI